MNCPKTNAGRNGNRSAGDWKNNQPIPMPKKTEMPGRKTPTTDQTIADRAKKAAGSLTAQRLAGIGRTSRTQGHVSAQNKRNQGKRDSRDA